MESDINWDWLKTFLAVVEAGSISGAAISCHVCLNTVRLHIAKLENYIGEPLLIRKQKGVIPTAFGEHIALIARTMREKLAGLQQN